MYVRTRPDGFDLHSDVHDERGLSHGPDGYAAFLQGGRLRAVMNEGTV